jgi:hypothetical protein
MYNEEEVVPLTMDKDVPNFKTECISRFQYPIIMKYAKFIEIKWNHCTCYSRGFTHEVEMSATGSYYLYVACSTKKYHDGTACQTCPCNNLCGTADACYNAIGECECNNGYYNNGEILDVAGSAQICLACPQPMGAVIDVDKTIDCTGFNGPTDCVCIKNYYNLNITSILLPRYRCIEYNICEPCRNGKITVNTDAKSQEECMCPANMFYEPQQYGGGGSAVVVGVLLLLLLPLLLVVLLRL